MRLYGKKFFANRTEARISDRKESRDALVYDIDELNRWCRVKVAGSDAFVRAWFPANFMRAPGWLKVGAAVRIAHVGGDKSRIEAVSPGLVQPTYTVPQMYGGVDTILTGMMPTAPHEDVTGWTVRISAGTYRINGVTYNFAPDGPVMNLDGWHMGDGGDMSGTYWLGSVDPISPHDEGELWFRYDAFVIGTDGVIDYLKGDEWEWVRGGSGPVKPQVPIGHVFIRNYILLNSMTPAITQDNIGKEWVALYPDRLVVEVVYSTPTYTPTDKYKRDAFHPDVGVIWGGPDVYVPSGEGQPERGAIAQDMQASATITVVDQFGNPYSWWSSGSINQLEFRSIGISMFGDPDGELEEGHSYYGDVFLGLGSGRLPPPSYLPEYIEPNHEGFGWPSVVSLGLGSSYTISYRRHSGYISQPDPGLAGYPGYYQGTSSGFLGPTSTTAIIQVSLVSPDAIHPVMTIFLFVNLDASGNPM